MSLFDDLFHRLSENHTEPVVGGIYVLHNASNNPFESRSKCRVLDVKSGYVQYVFVYEVNEDLERAFKWSHKIVDFNRMYKLEETPSCT